MANWRTIAGAGAAAAAAFALAACGNSAGDADQPAVARSAAEAGPEPIYCVETSFGGGMVPQISATGCNVKADVGRYTLAVYEKSGTIVSVTNISNEIGSDSACALGDGVAPIKPGESASKLAGQTVQAGDMFLASPFVDSDTAPTQPCVVKVVFQAS